MKESIRKEILSGIVVAIALVPEAIGFAFVLGIDPMIAIYTSIILGMVTSLVGGRPALITASTGAISSVFVTLVSDHGIEYLFYAVMLMGVIQIILAKLNIGQLMILISTPIMLGFVNGLAYIVLTAQFGQFYVPGTDQLLSGVTLLLMIGLVIFTILQIVLIPKVIKAIPSTLIAIITGTILSLILRANGFTVYTVYDYAGTHLSGGLPMIHIPDVPINFELLTIIFVPALSAAIVGLIESLLTLNIIDDMTDTAGNVKKEGVGLGIANIVSGLFGGMGGCAVLGQSLININNGARSYVSSFSAAAILLLFVLFGSSLLELIPLGVLVGIMLVVVYKTFAWESLVLHRYAEKFDIIVVVIVTALTMITHNLAIAVISGVLISTFKFTWDKSKRIEINRVGNEIKVEGLLYFATTDNAKKQLRITNNTIIDLSNAKVLDYTAADMLNNIIAKAAENGYIVELIGVNRESAQRLGRAKHN